MKLSALCAGTTWNLELDDRAVNAGDNAGGSSDFEAARWECAHLSGAFFTLGNLAILCWASQVILLWNHMVCL